ncbi:hypothetical protein CVT24_001197 [Panaeolus cyanescens]|uniref:HNH nuclease domain-containing protein n=1 Tax=Panaeolus cyanescens TaxID=181874 RepID=A0A409W6X2_9AGAR|nr:hypothetical protein CVT24_001197 [Panaeolus cyanescens]
MSFPEPISVSASEQIRTRGNIDLPSHPPSLPAHPSLPGHPTANPTTWKAYQTCLNLQNVALSQKSLSALIRARILGYLIIHAPSPAAQMFIAEEINRHALASVSTNDNIDGLRSLASGLWKHVFYQFIVYPVELTTMEERADFPADSSEALALMRDHYQCFISGTACSHYNLFELRKPSVPRDIIDGMVVVTRIIPAIEDTKITDIPGITPLTVRQFLKSYGDVHIIKEMDALEDTRNLFSANDTIAFMFQKMDLWLIKDPNSSNPTTWSVKANNQLHLMCPVLPRVEYKPFVTSIFPPDPRYFRLHGIIAHVGHLSGCTPEIYHRQVVWEEYVDGIVDYENPEAKPILTAFEMADAD